MFVVIIWARVRAAGLSTDNANYGSCAETATAAWTVYGNTNSQTRTFLQLMQKFSLYISESNDK